MDDNNLSPQAKRLRKKQTIETLAVEVGDERAKLEDELLVNRQSIMDRMKEAREAGIPFDAFAKLVRVSRQTLYRWEDSQNAGS